ncbi:MAG: DUF5668 domain-containing protein [Candidatus Paceibacterota bacterium]
MFIGIAIVIIGVVILMQNLGIITYNAWQIIWPALIILLGLSLIFKSSCCRSGRRMRFGQEAENKNKGE